MTERWRDKLGRLGREDPDRDRIRSLAGNGPRMPPVDEGPGTGRRVLAAVVALTVAAGSIALVVTVFNRGTTPSPVASTTGPTTAPPTDSTSTPATSVPVVSPSLDPAAICDVPQYDPDVTLLVGNDTVEYPTSVLDEPGAPASQLHGPAVDALVARLADPAAVNAPTDGWRQIASETRLETFAAPVRPGEWWIEAFEPGPQGSWRRADEEIVQERQTPAQLGHGLELRWNGELRLDGGSWNDPLEIVNGRPDAADVGAWADLHVYDAANNEIARSGPAVAFLSGASIAPGEAGPVPVALGSKVAALEPGTYSTVACVPGLGLASPVETLRVADTGVVADIRVLTYPFTGAAMDALAFGILADVNGCLGLEQEGNPNQTTYVLWPEGYALVERGGRTVLINPVGDEVAALGDDVSLGGGGAPLRLITVIGGVPASCREAGEGYFITSGAT